MIRRVFNKRILGGLLGAATLGIHACKNSHAAIQNVNSNRISDELFFKLSLAQWSFHRAIRSGDMDHLEFAAKAKALNFEGIEYVNQFFNDKANDKSYLEKMIQAADKSNVRQLLIMIDGEGGLASVDKAERQEAVSNHVKWIDAAKFLGCHSIRVNCYGEGTREEVAVAGIDGLSRLSEIAAKKSINVIVENHGGYSSDGLWLSHIIASVKMDNCGTLPDFGNFCLEREGGARWGAPCVSSYDMYKGVEEMMPFAKAVSAKSFDFDQSGKETKIDYVKMLKIIKASGFSGYIGVEYEGDQLSESDGIIKTRDLLINSVKLI